MKDLYLTGAQIERLSKGGAVHVSRKGCDITIASKKALKANKETEKKVKRLERELEKLKAQNVIDPPHECEIYHKKFWKPKMHMALAHNGRKSNLPHLKPRS